MSKKSLEKSYSELLKNLWNEYSFYIPKNDITTEFSDKLDSINASDILNKMFVIDKMRGPIEYKIELSHKVFSKSTMLEDNMYLLLKMKRKLNTQEFDFLIEKYFKQTQSFFFIANWINIDLDKNSPAQINDSFKGVLKLQYSAYKEHLGKLIKHFYPNREEFPENDINIIKELEKHFPKLLKKEKGIFNIDVATLFKNKEITSKSNKKELLLTGKDADVFLLESVFNLKVK